MVSTLVQFDRANLDKRLLWSADQGDLAERFGQLAHKCQDIGENAPLVLVTTDVVDTHLIAAFNLATSFSLLRKTMLIDTTPKAQLVTGVLGIGSSSDSGLLFVNRSLAVAALRDQHILPDGWPTNVYGQVADQMICIVTVRDAFQVNWAQLGEGVKVIAMAAPNELEEDRWSHLLAQVSSSRFLGLWVVD